MPLSQETCSLYHLQKHNKPWVASYRKKEKKNQNIRIEQKQLEDNLAPNMSHRG